MAEPRRPAVGVVGPLVAVGAGAATSFLQTVLPFVVASFANSAGSWCALAWLLARPARSAPLGAARCVVALVGLVAGYYVTADLRGFGVYAPTVGTWLVAAALVGPVLGASAVVSRRAGEGSARSPERWVRVLAVLVLPALLAAEAAFGLLVVRATTSTAYWVGQAVVALVIAVVGVVRASGRPRHPGPTPHGGLDPVSVR